MDGKIINLKKLFLQKISLNDKNDEEITQTIDEILYKLIDSPIETLRQKSANLSYELHELGSNAVPYLLLLFFNKLEAVSYKPTVKYTKVESIFDEKLIYSFFKECFDLCSEGGLRVLTFKIPLLDPSDEKVIYSSTRHLLDKYIVEPINIQELSTDMQLRMVCLGISKALSRKLNCQDEFYIQFSAILSRMNRDGLYQEARDYAEEALLCSDESGELYFGLNIRFSLYSEQMNIIDSLLNGCLLLTSLHLKENIPDSLIKKLYVDAFIALRTFGLFKYSKDVYVNHVKSLQLDAYERQKCDLANFYLALMENDSSVVAKSDSYISNNKENIAEFGNASLIPWLSFIYNVKTIFAGDFGSANHLSEFENEIASKMSRHEVEAIKNKILGDCSGSKEVIISGLINLSRTRNKSDFIHEVNQLVVTANRVIETSIANNDVEGVLLGHQLKSDGSVYFNGMSIQAKNGLIHHTFDLSDENSSRFKNYIEYVIGELSAKPNVQYIWLGFKNNKLYCVIFENGSFLFCNYVESTNKKEIDEWIGNQLSNLGFEDTPNTGSPFITKEDFWINEKESILKSLPRIDIPISSREIVLFSDVEFSSFPHNMIKSDDKIISLYQGITSPLSFDNYLKYGRCEVNIDSVYAWAPIVEGDFAISIAFSKLKEELLGDSVIFDEGDIPEPCKDINIFISHGGRSGSAGFCGLYPSTEKAYDLESIFGRGKVAILFVCHSGSIVKHHFSNSTHTLVKKLLSDGYECVISPSWGLNIAIPGIWTKSFMENFRAGKDISDAVFKANSYVDSIYLSPSASTAMHIFGNKSVKCTANKQI